MGVLNKLGRKHGAILMLLLVFGAAGVIFAEEITGGSTGIDFGKAIDTGLHPEANVKLILSENGFTHKCLTIETGQELTDFDLALYLKDTNFDVTEVKNARLDMFQEVVFLSMSILNISALLPLRL